MVNWDVITVEFIDTIKEKAKSEKKRIVLPESMDRRVLEACDKILKDGFADLILIGDFQEIKKLAFDLDLHLATIINPYDSPLTEEFILKLVELRKDKGMTYDKAKKL